MQDKVSAKLGSITENAENKFYKHDRVSLWLTADKNGTEHLLNLTIIENHFKSKY